MIYHRCDCMWNVADSSASVCSVKEYDAVIFLLPSLFPSLLSPHPDQQLQSKCTISLKKNRERRHDDREVIKLELICCANLALQNNLRRGVRVSKGGLPEIWSTQELSLRKGRWGGLLSMCILKGFGTVRMALSTGPLIEQRCDRSWNEWLVVFLCS